MESLITELTRYMDASEGRGNKVISISGLRAMIDRHRHNVVKPLEPLVNKVDVRILEKVAESHKQVE